VFIVTGSFDEGALPRYLREEWHAPIRARLERLRLEQGPIEEAKGPFAGANLSDVFEYMGPEEFRRASAALLERMRPDGRMVYWNMMAPRSRPAEFAARARPLAELAAALHERDRAWFYERLHVDEVIA
jgi:S-adenosylmethionine-diacylglycerol 3-amino-3-carboxypropyl transferase